MKPLWFGPEDRPLFGWLHVPESGRVRGGVLLCPTLGIQAVSAHYAYRRLADRLAEAGFLALRFDYDGTGDSAGQQDDPGRVAAWLGSIRIAVDFVRSLEIGRMSVVGMRMGAVLVAETFGSGPADIDDVVLWDPCGSGRAFLREQVALWSFALGARSNDDGSVETPGLVYDKDTAADLSSLAIANGDGPMADSLLVLMRSNRKGDRQMNERLAMPHVERIAIFGQEVLVDVTPDAATVPEETIEAIVDWLAARAGVGPTMLIDPDAIGRSRATVGTTPAGVAVDEWPVSLGPLGLFGIVTSQREADGGVITPDASPATGDASDIRSDVPTIFFFNAGVIDHVGPARLWVQLSRLWAEAGFRAVRFDLSGIGDSPVRVGQPGQIVYPPEALNDIRDVLRDVLPDDPSNAVLVGLCSGAYHAIEGALAYKVRGLCAVNPFFIFTRPKESALNTREQPSGAMKGWTRALFAHDQLASIVQRLPGAAWWIINRIALESPPTNTLSRVIDTGVNVFMIAGKNEAIQLSRGERWAVRRLRRTGRFRLEVVPDLEHTLFEQHGRVLATELLTEHVLSRYGTSVPRD